MKALLLCLLLLPVGFTCFAQTPADSVTISGRVTDFNGQPLYSVSVRW